MFQSQAHSGTSTKAIAQEVHAIDAKLIQQTDHIFCGVTVVVALDLRLVRATEARLIDQNRAELLSEAWQGWAKVRP